MSTIQPLLALASGNYIQPLQDSNKRTSSLTANALPLAQHYALLSYQRISKVDSHQAMLTFYETSTLAARKAIVIQY